MIQVHEPKELVIGLDVDDVLLDLVGQWLTEYNEEWSDTLDKKDLHEWDFTKFVKPECGKRVYRLLKPEMYDRIKPLDGAVEFVQEIRNMGHVPRYITACGDPKNKRQHHAFAVAKHSSLIRHGIAVGNELLIPGRDKSRAPVDILIDDREENVESFRNGIAILFTQPWNKSSVLTRARSYDDALHIIDRYSRHIPPCED